ncbi:glycerol-3-phosphate 1-O-acyltransferase PlsB [Dechloromonas sp. H13]|uniref:glycerol-3-phosphate 1-O-acyltransferase PlsB n=1 Tax=Dechloromonas sp. H13 TaxID=2570193 RepID=UPI0018859E5A|nr:glycerol-3-phosphate 1-O-acyltransferase PlsB [Dechloromonas sp. H13]
MFDISGWFVPLARRVLYAWVRTTVFAEAATVDPARPVCYVLQDRHLSNLLVLFEESRRAGLPPGEAPLACGAMQAKRSVFFLNRRHASAAPSPALVGLVKAVVADPTLDVQLVPVVILWGRSPAKQESILKALLAETWRTSGMLRQFFAVLLHGRQTLVRFNPPLSLRELVHGGASPLGEGLALRKLSRVLRVHFRRQREMAIGPDLSHRNTQVEVLLASEPVRAAIAAEASRRGISGDEARARAQKFALEIASDYSYGVVRAMELFLSWLWEHLYDGIEVQNFDVVTRIAPGQGIVYVPCHRSHIDYLLLSYLIYRNGLTPPHIAAGDNLDMPLVGPLLRRGGAFFLRRSFKGEPLYAAVFDEYLYLMQTRGFPIEYFIEGGRSRTGRTLTPKAGILGMSVRSFVRSHSRPLVFVPVYIGYERLIEGQTYVRELAGRPKQGESLWQLAKSVRSIRRVFGKVHVNFGDPLPLAGFLDRHDGDWRTLPADGEWLRAATRNAAGELAKRINEAAVINPVSLIALGLLATPECTADEYGLRRMIAHYQAVDAAAPYSPQRIACTLDPAQVIAHAARLGIVEEIQHPFGNLVRVVDAQLEVLPYFRNNVLHLFAVPALVACLLGNNRSLDIRRLSDAVLGIYRLMRSELFLRWSEEELLAEVQRVVTVFAERGLLIRTEPSGWLRTPETNSLEYPELLQIGETLRPMLGRHFLVLALLQQRGSGAQTRRVLEQDCQLLTQRLALLHGFSAAEVADRSVFASFVANLLDSELLREDDEGLLHFDEHLLGPLAYAELVLPADARQAIRRIAVHQAT